MGGFLARCGRSVMNTWLAYQVELHGQYSAARVQAFQAYSQRTSPLRMIAISLSTPMLSLALVILVDCIPLAPPGAGAGANYVFWCRNMLTVAFMTYGPIKQFQELAQQTAFTSRRIAVIVTVSTVTGVGFQFLMALTIGFPLPFSLAIGLPVWALTIFFFFIVYFGRSAARRGTIRSSNISSDRVSYRKIWNYVYVFLCQASLVVVFPAYIYGFQSVSSSVQAGFVLLLPIIKITYKNWLCHLLGHCDDIKPEFVIFNIEIFNAIYVSCCMQSSSSITTTIFLTLLDWAQGLLSIRDVNEMLAEIREFTDKIPPGNAWYGKSCVEIALLILEKDLQVRNHPSLSESSNGDRGSMRTARSLHSLSITKKNPKQNSIVPLSTTEQFRSVKNLSAVLFTTADAATVSSPQKQHLRTVGEDRSGGYVSALPVPYIATKKLDKSTTTTNNEARDDIFFDDNERLVFTQKTAQLLFTTEFVILIEFTEVIVPIIYSMYCTAVFHLPNRAYYPQLAYMDASLLQRTVANVIFYAGLELLSFLVMSLILQRRLGIATLRQLAFVLDTQWTMVQAMLLLWIFYAVQNSLFHFGADFSFQFAWLQSQS